MMRWIAKFAKACAGCVYRFFASTYAPKMAVEVSSVIQDVRGAEADKVPGNGL